MVCAAALDPAFRRLLLRERGRALCEVSNHPCAPAGVRLTADDRLALSAIRASTLHEFARGIQRLSMLAGGDMAELAVSEALSG